MLPGEQPTLARIVAEMSVVAQGDHCGRRGEAAAEHVHQCRVPIRSGMFWNRLMVGCEHRSRPLSGACPNPRLNRGSGRNRRRPSSRRQSRT